MKTKAQMTVKKSLVAMGVLALMGGGSAFAQSYMTSPISSNTVYGALIHANNDGTNDTENVTLRAGNGGNSAANGNASSFLNLFSSGTADLYGVANVNIVGNYDNSTGGEGVFIRSNATTPQSYVYAGSDGVLTMGSANTANIISSAVNVSGSTSINTTGTASTAIGNATGTVGVTGSAINLTGATNITGNTAITGDATVTGTTTLNGATNINGVSTLVGTSSINTTGSAATSIGNSASTVSINGGTNTVTGTTNINTTGAANTTIGNGNNTVSLNGGTNNMTGVSNNITATGTTAILSATNTITATGDNSISGANNTMTASVANTLNAATNSIQGTTQTSINTGTGTGTVSVGNAGNTTNLNSATNNIGVNAYATTNNIGTGTAVSTNNMGNSVATTTVHTQAGNAQMNLANNSATLTVPSGATGVSNGVAVSPAQSAMTGGNTDPTRMTLTDNAATFSRVSNGAPIKVTGVADGRWDFDAVNVRQFAGAVASVAAQANIPALAAGQDRAFGVGLGNFMGKSGLALGMSMRGNSDSVFKLSVSTGLNGGGAQTTVGAGAAWAF